VNFGFPPDPASHSGTRPLSALAFCSSAPPSPRDLRALSASALSFCFSRHSFTQSKVEGSLWAVSGFSLQPFNFKLSIVDPSSLLSATVQINIIPKTLAFLCFHTTTNSFASCKTLSPIVSSASELLAQDTRGRGTPSNPNSSPSPSCPTHYALLPTHCSLSPLQSTLTKNRGAFPRGRSLCTGPGHKCRYLITSLLRYVVFLLRFRGLPAGSAAAWRSAY
jgi:hypothetical protein